MNYSNYSKLLYRWLEIVNLTGFCKLLFAVFNWLSQLAIFCIVGEGIF